MSEADESTENGRGESSSERGKGSGGGESSERGKGSGSGESSERGGTLETDGRSQRARIRSAALWGVAAALTFLVLAQGYLLVGGSLPVRYSRLFGLGFLVGLVAAGATYATEHRLTAKRRV